MKINSFFFGLDRTGGTLVLLRYLERLRDMGHDISITTLGREDDPRFVAPPEGTTVRYVGLRGRPYRAAIHLSPGRLPFPIFEQRRLRAAAPSADLHIVGYSLTLRPALEMSEPILYHVQHFEPLIVEGVLARREAWASYEAAPHITCNCAWVASEVRAVGGRVEAVIPPGFDSERFRFVPPDERDESVVRVLTLGKAAAWKGLSDAVSAVRELASRLHPIPVELHTYGQDAPRGDLGDARGVHHGVLDLAALNDLQSRMTVSLTSSWYESFPLPPLEAMACGTPVVTTPIGTEDYAVNGENCVIVPPKDPRAMSAALHDLCTSVELRSRLASAGRRTAIRFTWDRAESAFAAQVEAAASRPPTMR